MCASNSPTVIPPPLENPLPARMIYARVSGQRLRPLSTFRSSPIRRQMIKRPATARSVFYGADRSCKVANRNCKRGRGRERKRERERKKEHATPRESTHTWGLCPPPEFISIHRPSTFMHAPASYTRVHMYVHARKYELHALSTHVNMAMSIGARRHLHVRPVICAKAEERQMYIYIIYIYIYIRVRLSK